VAAGVAAVFELVPGPDDIAAQPDASQKVKVPVTIRK
jgi:hypothetical protein